MGFKISSGVFGKDQSETLVLFATQGKRKDSPTKGGNTAEANGAKVDVWGHGGEGTKKILQSAQDGAFSGRAGEAIFFRDANVSKRHVLAVGLGATGSLTEDSLRRAGAVAYKALLAAKVETAGIYLPKRLGRGIAHGPAAHVITEGILMAAYKFSELKTQSKDGKKGLKEIGLLVDLASQTSALAQGVKSGTVVGEAICFARRLSDLPGNLKCPRLFANAVAEEAKGSGVKVQIWNKARIKKEKMGSFLSVSKGSNEDPRFIALEYRNGGKSAPIAFVGKGLTFDSGGISIKPSAQMEEMKFDMCGGANVVATTLAIARLKMKLNVVCFVPCSENMPGPLANKPGDVVTARNGITIEVNNTDAEGRLILADALVWASEQKPSVVIDAATLTGAMAISLGDCHTGYFSRNDKLCKMLEAAANHAGERIWRMPLVDDHVENMKGNYADLSNISYAKGAGSAHGAAFLESFVDKNIPWAHFDIAATAWHLGHKAPYNPSKGATGVMIRTFMEFARTWKA